jgi:ElaB/YqjD/DUF883 family membrane-anchored ribosome-binding protein
MGQSTYIGKPDQISDFKEKATEQLGRVADRAESVANRVAGQGREASERMREVGSNVKGALDKSMRDQPMAPLATAAIVGFVPRGSVEILKPGSARCLQAWSGKRRQPPAACS